MTTFRTNSFDTEMSAGLNADNSAAVTHQKYRSKLDAYKEPSEAVGVDKGEVLHFVQIEWILGRA